MSKSLDWLIGNAAKANLVEDLDEDTRTKLATRVARGFSIDEESCREWREKTEIGLKIAEQITEHKTFPWPDAANVKFPLIATASIQFAARAYPNIIQGTEVVKTKVVGHDPTGEKAARAKRVRQHLSYQCTEEMEGWEEGVDKLLHSLPVIGTCFKKTYFSKLRQTNVSEYISPLDVVVNDSAKSLETARRVTHKIHLYRNDVVERERDGQFIDLQAEYMQETDDENRAECFLEQHCWADLDEDGYEEPYIVTIHEDSQTLVRVVARYEVDGISVTLNNKVRKIEAIQYFTMFGFIPSPSGKFYYLGFAHLLGPINESINTILNQLLDAGTLANLQGGFLAKGLRLQGGAVRFKPGEWKSVDVTGGILRDGIFPLPVKEPSNVLFSLLGLLNETGMKLASVSEAMTGDTPSQNTPAATTLAMIEQGLKVFTAIYKRVYRSLTQEYRKLYWLNSRYLDEETYFTVLDSEVAVARADYNTTDFNVFPVADPSLASEAQKIAKSQALMQTWEQNPSQSGKIEILRQHYEAIGAENIDKLLPEQEIQQLLTAPAPPDPKLIQVQLDGVQKQHQDEIAKAKLPFELEKLESEIDEIKARTRKLLAEAEAAPLMNQLTALESMVAALQQDTRLEIDRLKAERTPNGEGQPESGDTGDRDEGGAAGMAPAPDDGQGAGPGGAGDAELGAGLGGGGDLESRLGGTDGTADYAALGENLRREAGVELEGAGE